MSARAALARVAAVVAVFAASVAVGNALGEDERAAPTPAPAKRAAVPLGSLRLEPAPALPELRTVPVRRAPAPAATGPAPAATGPPAEGSGGAPSEDDGYVAPSPEPPAASTPSAGSEPSVPAPPRTPTSPPPSATDTPDLPYVPAPDPAPMPVPVPRPDPSPNGGSGQFGGG